MALINTFIHVKLFQIPLRLLYKLVPLILGTGILLTSRDGDWSTPANTCDHVMVDDTKLRRGR